MKLTHAHETATTRGRKIAYIISILLPRDMYQAMSGEKGSSSALHRLKCSRFVLDSARNIDIHQLCSVNSQALKQQQRDEHCQGHPTSIKGIIRYPIYVFVGQDKHAELLSTNKWRSAFKFNSSSAPPSCSLSSSPLNLLQKTSFGTP